MILTVGKHGLELEQFSNLQTIIQNGGVAIIKNLGETYCYTGKKLTSYAKGSGSQSNTWQVSETLLQDAGPAYNIAIPMTTQQFIDKYASLENDPKYTVTFQTMYQNSYANSDYNVAKPDLRFFITVGGQSSTQLPRYYTKIVMDWVYYNPHSNVPGTTTTYSYTLMDTLSSATHDWETTLVMEVPVNYSTLVPTSGSISLGGGRAVLPIRCVDGFLNFELKATSSSDGSETIWALSLSKNNNTQPNIFDTSRYRAYPGSVITPEITLVSTNRDDELNNRFNSLLSKINDLNTAVTNIVTLQQTLESQINGVSTELTNTANELTEQFEAKIDETTKGLQIEIKEATDAIASFNDMTQNKFVSR